jgi:acetyl-CoA C-acetyltransferase
VLRDGLNDAFSDAHSGWHTEDLVEKYQVAREAQDSWAFRSQQWFAAAQTAGHFKSQIVPVEVAGKKGRTQFDTDELNRPDTTLESLARLKPAFRPNGTITACNAPGLNDAASAVVLAEEVWADKRGVAPDDRPQDRRIRVNAISPGSIDTPGLGELLASSPVRNERRKMISSLVPLGRLGEPDEIAKAVVFLASDDSSYVSGVELFVDGGFAQV